MKNVIEITVVIQETEEESQIQCCQRKTANVVLVFLHAEILSHIYTRYGHIWLCDSASARNPRMPSMKTSKQSKSLVADVSAFE